MFPWTRQFSVRDSKFGQVLVIESTERSGGYILGFRIDPASRLREVLQEVNSLYKTQLRNPELGVMWNAPAVSWPFQSLVEYLVYITTF